jgi:hypothetical protein
MTATLFELFDEHPGGPLLVHDYKWAPASSWKGKLWDALTPRWLRNPPLRR